MFDFSFPEMVVLGVVALVVLGPEELPRVARGLGKMMGKVQAHLGQFKHEVKQSINLDLDEWHRFEEFSKNERQALQEKVKDTLDQK
jgi:sec-independent protein translocase protein TatB